MQRIGAMTIIAAGLLWAGLAFAQAPTPEGRWITASGNFEIEIAPCGDALCGTVARVMANNSMSGAGQVAEPPPPIGAQIITGLHRDGRAWRGRIYNREDKKTYDCVVRPQANGALEVRPYVGIELVGRSQIWRKASS